MTLLGLFDYCKKEIPADFKILLILVLIEFLKSIIKLLLIILLFILSRWYSIFLYSFNLVLVQDVNILKDPFTFSISFNPVILTDVILFF